MLYLIRHGETAAPKGLCIGQTDVALSASGIDDITQHTLPELQTLVTAQPRIVASPLQRTMRTAQIITAGFDVPITQEPSLKEINMGEWDGLPFDDIKQKWPGAYTQRGTNFTHFRPPHGESFWDVQQRALKAIIPLCQCTEPLLLITHAGVIRSVLCAANQTPLQELFKYSPATGSITPLDKKQFLEHATSVIEASTQES
ncbi:MAG: alpha-ribazole phosphatase family protein [Desulfovibrionales bacterium]|nr:alpha-ribazole phosphatase family protein [Desulfovibrionales bacterium]